VRAGSYCTDLDAHHVAFPRTCPSCGCFELRCRCSLLLALRVNSPLTAARCPCPCAHVPMRRSQSCCWTALWSCRRRCRSMRCSSVGHSAGKKNRGVGGWLTHRPCLAWRTQGICLGEVTACHIAPLVIPHARACAWACYERHGLAMSGATRLGIWGVSAPRHCMASRRSLRMLMGHARVCVCACARVCVYWWYGRSPGPTAPRRASAWSGAQIGDAAGNPYALIMHTLRS